MMTPEESIGFLKTYVSSLKKQIAEKDVEIGKLKSYIDELEAEKRLAKGERKKLKEQDLIKEYVQKLNDAKVRLARLKKDNEELIYKLNKKDVLQKPQ
jgi:chromosome segregation ATPase